MLRLTVIYYFHGHTSSDASLQQSDMFFPEVSQRLCNPPTLSRHKHNGIVTDRLNTKWIALAVPLIV